MTALVLYLGQDRLRMKDPLDAGSATVQYVIIDIRDIDAEALLAGGPGDWALALLAKGGPGKMRKILRLAMTLPTAPRDRVLTQIGALSGLRRLSDKFKIEVEKMGLQINIEENAFLRDIRDKGIAIGMAQGMAKNLCDLLDAKFGAVPVWAVRRVNDGSEEQRQLWTRRVLTARSLEGVLGKR